MDWQERGKLVKALQEAVETQDQDPDFFNRKWELKALLAGLATEADNVIVVVGPSNCGKTLLLRRLETIWCSKSDLVATSPIFYFDLRKQGWKTPGDAARHLALEFRSWKDVVLMWADGVKSGLSGVTLKPSVNRISVAEIALRAITDALPSFDSGAKGGDLSKVMDAFTAVLNKSKAIYPIFIIDEANQLTEWDKKDVRALAGFFKSLVKQDRRAYLILSSSDSAFELWLNQMFHADEWRAFGIGFFSEAEARRFFTGMSIPRAFGTMPPTFQDSDWQDVYAVCGGSPLLLNQCAKTALICGLSWQDAAETLLSTASLSVQLGMDATKEEMGFNGENYKSICKVIVEHGFMGMRELLKEIYKGEVKQANVEIQAMLAANLIHLRFITPATHYTDIDRNRVGKERKVVMARSPAECAAMKELLTL